MGRASLFLCLFIGTQKWVTYMETNFLSQLKESPAGDAGCGPAVVNRPPCR